MVLQSTQRTDSASRPRNTGPDRSARAETRASNRTIRRTSARRIPVRCFAPDRKVPEQCRTSGDRPCHQESPPRDNEAGRPTSSAAKTVLHRADSENRPPHTHRHNAVVLLAAAPRMLPLHAWSFGSLFVIVCFVDDTDGHFVSVFGANNFLQPLPHEVFIPSTSA